MEQFTRAERKELRRLAGLAYERELAHELTTIEAAFRAWRAGELSPFDLSDRIHAFHNGVARDLFVTYNRWDPETAVPRALAFELLLPSEISPPVLKKLQERVGFYRRDIQREASVDPAG